MKKKLDDSKVQINISFERSSYPNDYNSNRSFCIPKKKKKEEEENLMDYYSVLVVCLMFVVNGYILFK